MILPIKSGWTAQSKLEPEYSKKENSNKNKKFFLSNINSTKSFFKLLKLPLTVIIPKCSFKCYNKCWEVSHRTETSKWTNKV